MCGKSRKSKCNKKGEFILERIWSYDENLALNVYCFFASKSIFKKRKNYSHDCLAHLFPIHSFSTLWFSDLFRGRERVHWEQRYSVFSRKGLVTTYKKVKADTQNKEQNLWKAEIFQFFRQYNYNLSFRNDFYKNDTGPFKELMK